MTFVIDGFSRQYPAMVNTTNVVALGHSTVGATVVEATLNDTRIKGGINLDGRLFGSIEKPNITLSKPCLQFVSKSYILDPDLR